MQTKKQSTNKQLKKNTCKRPAAEIASTWRNTMKCEFAAVQCHHHISDPSSANTAPSPTVQRHERPALQPEVLRVAQHGRWRAKNAQTKACPHTPWAECVSRQWAGRAH